MTSSDVSDEELLASRDPASFALFYRRHVEELRGFFSRRTRDAELAAIRMNKLVDAQRRGAPSSVGAAGMAAVGGRLWIVSPGGDLLVVG